MYTMIIFHNVSCVWILIGQTDKGWVDSISDPNLKGDYLYIYVTAFYFITTTATTVGYGDYFPLNNWEKLFAVFLELAAILIFSVIIGNLRDLKSSKSTKTIIDEHVSTDTHFDLKIT